MSSNLSIYGGSLGSSGLSHHIPTLHSPHLEQVVVVTATKVPMVVRSSILSVLDELKVVQVQLSLERVILVQAEVVRGDSLHESLAIVYAKGIAGRREGDDVLLTTALDLEEHAV